jgi:hypothetical protein
VVFGLSTFREADSDGNCRARISRDGEGAFDRSRRNSPRGLGTTGGPVGPSSLRPVRFFDGNKTSGSVRRAPAEARVLKEIAGAIQKRLRTVPESTGNKAHRAGNGANFPARSSPNLVSVSGLNQERTQVAPPAPRRSNRLSEVIRRPNEGESFSPFLHLTDCNFVVLPSKPNCTPRKSRLFSPIASDGLVPDRRGEVLAEPVLGSYAARSK